MKRLSLFFAALLCSVNFLVHQPLKSEINIKQTAKIATEVLVGFYFFGSAAMNGLMTVLASKFPDAPPQVKTMLLDQLRVIGIDDPSIKIKYEEPQKMLIGAQDCYDAYASSLINSIIISEALASGNCDMQDPFFKGLIQHEGTHLKNNDSHTIIMFMFLFYVYAAYKKNLLLLMLYPLLKLPIEMYHEKRADDAIQDDIAVLAALAKYCKHYAEYERKIVTNYDLLDTIKYKISHFFDPHMSYANRAAYFEERIKKLQIKENNSEQKPELWQQFAVNYLF